MIEKERPEGIIVQFGGQTPLKLASAIQKALEDNPIPAASGEPAACVNSVFCPWERDKGRVRVQGLPPDSVPCHFLTCLPFPLSLCPHPCSSSTSSQSDLVLPAPPCALLDPPPAGKGNVRIWGTQPNAIDEAEDRDRWMELLKRLEIRQPDGGLATNEEEALAIANKVGAGWGAGWGCWQWCMGLCAGQQRWMGGWVGGWVQLMSMLQVTA